MIKRQHISFDHGPPVGSHSAGLAGVVGYLFFFFARLFQSVVCFFFQVLLYFLSLERTKQRERETERERERQRNISGGKGGKYIGVARTVKRRLDGLALASTHGFFRS